MAFFIVQLAQDHVVLEEKLVSHTKSAEKSKMMKQGALTLAWLEVNHDIPHQHCIRVFIDHAFTAVIIRKLILRDCGLINFPSDIQSL